MTAAANQAYTGVFPIAPTPFAENGDLDVDGMKRVLDCMVEKQYALIVGSYLNFRLGQKS